MGMLITAIALAASLVQPHAASPTRQLAVRGTVPQTLYTSPSTIQAFAQDGPLLAWFSPSTKACNAVWVLSLANGGQFPPPGPAPGAPRPRGRAPYAPPPPPPA